MTSTNSKFSNISYISAKINGIMKKHILIILALVCAVFSAQAQHRADRQNLTDPNSTSVILLGDPQGYMKYDLNQPIFDLVTAWIADNVDHLNIEAVLCLGDLVEQNDNNVLNRKMLNQTSAQMWEAVSKSFKRIDGKVLHVHSPGNHDYGFKAAEDEHTFYPDHFPAERQGAVLLDRLVAEYPNREGRASLENSAYELKINGWDRKVLVVTSEFAPSDGALEWARKLCTSDKYKDHVVIYMTHSYMKCSGLCDNALISQEKYPLTQKAGNNSGEQIWEKLVSQVPNIRLVLCGHHAHGVGKDGKDQYEGSIGWRTDRNAVGADVHQMLFDTQTLGGGWEGNGGDGWIRILEFMPDGRTVQVRTYSPLFGISPVTRHLASRTGKLDRFEFIID